MQGSDGSGKVLAAVGPGGPDVGRSGALEVDSGVDQTDCMVQRTLVSIPRWTVYTWRGTWRFPQKPQARCY